MSLREYLKIATYLEHCKKTPKILNWMVENLSVFYSQLNDL